MILVASGVLAPEEARPEKSLAELAAFQDGRGHGGDQRPAVMDGILPKLRDGEAIAMSSGHDCTFSACAPFAWETNSVRTARKFAKSQSRPGAAASSSLVYG